MCAVLLPAKSSVMQVERHLALTGSAYFLLIGLGFIFVEIGLLQRVSVFLGHPAYALIVGLFGIILSTGIGSLLSERIPLVQPARLLMRLVNRIDSRPTPWYWGVNGAAGVLAAGLAVVCSIGFSVDATIQVGGACYALLIPFALLLNAPRSALAAREMISVAG